MSAQAHAIIAEKLVIHYNLSKTFTYYAGTGQGEVAKNHQSQAECRKELKTEAVEIQNLIQQQADLGFKLVKSESPDPCDYWAASESGFGLNNTLTFTK